MEEHEKQERLLCGKHALNALLRRCDRASVSKDDFDRAAQELDEQEREILAKATWLPSFENSWPYFGNYSVGVLEKVAAQRGIELRYLNLRQVEHELSAVANSSSSTPTSTSRFVGLLCNVPRKVFFITTRHWIAIIPSPDNSHFLNMDSKLPEPARLVSVQAVLTLLQSERKGATTTLGAYMVK